jgi:hypothetical protein
MLWSMWEEFAAEYEDKWTVTVQSKLSFSKVIHSEIWFWIFHKNFMVYVDFIYIVHIEGGTQVEGVWE